MNIPILNQKLEVVGDYSINPSVCANPEISVLSELIRWQLANRRHNIQNVKNRSMVSGAHRKLWRQKGTGRARQGDGKACHFRGGGAAFKIIERNHQFKLNKKFKKLALRMALTDRQNHLSILENFMDINLNKTKDCQAFINSLISKRENPARKILFLTDKYTDVISRLRGSRNLHNVSIIPVSNFNVLGSIKSEIVIDVQSMKVLEEKLL